MAANGPAKGSATEQGNSDNWNEERLEEAMEHLKLMHIKIRELRTTIPRMLQPLTDKQPTPEALYRSFSASVATAQKEVKDYTALRNDQKSQQILDHAAQRRKEEPKGIKHWSPLNDPNWLTPKNSS